MSRELLKRALKYITTSFSTEDDVSFITEIEECLAKPDEPLSEDMLINLIPTWDCEIDWHVDATIAFARAIEAAHGIGVSDEPSND